MQHFNFSTMRNTNPLMTVTHFFVNPANPLACVLLNLYSKVNGKTKVELLFYHFIPVNLFPINILNLGQTLVQFTSETKGIIKKDNKVIHFTIQSDNIISIDSVL